MRVLVAVWLVLAALLNSVRAEQILKYDEYVSEVFRKSRDVNVYVHNGISDRCWVDTEMAKNKVLRALNEAGIKVRTEGDLTISLAVTGGGLIFEGAHIGCQAYLSFDVTHNASATAPNGEPLNLAHIVSFQRGSLLSGPDLDAEIPSKFLDMTSEFLEQWLNEHIL